MIGNSVENADCYFVAGKRVNGILGTSRKGTDGKAGTIVYCYINHCSSAF